MGSHRVGHDWVTKQQQPIADCFPCPALLGSTQDGLRSWFSLCSCCRLTILRLPHLAPLHLLSFLHREPVRTTQVWLPEPLVCPLLQLHMTDCHPKDRTDMFYDPVNILALKTIWYLFITKFVAVVGSLSCVQLFVIP